MKNDDKIKNFLKAGAIALGGTLILSLPASIVHNFDETRKINADSVLASELNYTANSAEENINTYLQDDNIININDCKKENLYTISSAIVATGSQIEKYLLAHEINSAEMDGKYFTIDGRNLEVIERKSADKIVKDGTYTYAAVDGYILEGRTYKKIKDIATISYSELEHYALLKTTKVYYSDCLDISPKHFSSYSLIKL